MRRTVGILFALTVASSGWVTAAPSGIAAPSATDALLSCPGGNSVAYSLTPFSMSPAITASPGDTFTITNGGSSGVGTATLTLPSGYSSSGGTVAEGSSVTITVGPATGTIVIAAAASGSACSGKPSASLQVQVTSGGGGSSSSSSSSTPTVETLNVEVSGSDTTCTGGNPSANFGSWLTLPSADECTQTGPKANPGAKLLGWATNPNFPQAIAQRQVDNGWGAYETFNEDGQLTGVFIPAGGATFVSGSNNLYPIWSS